MKSLSTPDNTKFSFTTKEHDINVYWEFNKDAFCWQILIEKNDEKEFGMIPASVHPSADGINEYDFERLSEMTLKLIDFIKSRLKLDSKTADK